MKTSMILFLLLFSASAFSQSPAFEKNAMLGRGINLGNMFEAPDETAWGNPFQDNYLKQIADLGFDHVRIPIRWETAARSMAESPYTIDPLFLERIQHVVDLALEHQLHVIINMHHHEALFEQPDDQKARFLAMWDQIASYFSDYPDHLIFELLNEPHGQLTATKWNLFLADAIHTIRSSNPTRFLLVGTAEWGGLGGLSKLQLPADDRLILTIHYYNPFSFTHQGADWSGDEAQEWLGTKWMDTESERQLIQSDFAPAIQYRETHQIPIHVGEFGAYSKADIESRARWTTYLARYFESQDFSWAYWEYSAGFGIYDRANQSFYTELVDALLHNEMPEPTPVNFEELFKTDFENDGDWEGWNLNNSNGASSAGLVSQGDLTIDIENGGTQAWHIQLAYPGLLLEEGKTYEIRIFATAETNRSITAYAGMNRDPWSSYSGYTTLNLSPAPQLFTINFQMPSSTDHQARLVLDLGYSKIPVSLHEVALYEVSFVTESPDTIVQTSFFYPNPTSGLVNFSTADSASIISVYSYQGRLIWQQQMPLSQQINLEKLPTGRYIIRWQSRGKMQVGKLIKQASPRF